MFFRNRLSAVISSTFIALTFSASALAAPAPKASLQLNPQSIAYGDKLLGSHTSATVTLTNTGTGAASAISFGAIGAPFGGTPGSCGSTLAPGASCAFSVDYSPATVDMHKDRLDVSYFNGAKSASERLSVSGRVLPATLEFTEAPTLDLATVLTSSYTPFQLHVRNSGGATATALDAPAQLYQTVNSTTCGAELAPGAECSYEATFVAPSVAGTYTSNFVLQYFNGSAAKTARVAVRALVVQPAPVPSPTPSPTPSPVPPLPAHATVIVLDHANNTPVAGADVTLSYANGVSATQNTNVDGEAAFSNQPINVAVTIVATQGAVSATYSSSGFISGENTTVMMLSFPPPVATVDVTAVDPHNEPVVGATVSIAYSNGAPGAAGTTNAAGLTQFTNQVTAVSATLNLTSACGNGVMTTTFAAGLNNVTLHATAVSSQVTVTVIGVDGSTPVAGADVTIGSATETTDASGQAVFASVPVGLAAVSASAPSGNGSTSASLLGCRDQVSVQLVEAPHPAGSVDTSFGAGGVLIDSYVNSYSQWESQMGSAVQADGKILLVGRGTDDSGATQLVIKRIFQDGTTDTSYGVNGRAIINRGQFNNFGEAKLQPDGKLVIAGGLGTSWDLKAAVFRLNADGSFDSSFGDNGVFTYNDMPGPWDLLTGVAIQADGKIVAGGYYMDQEAGTAASILRLNANGTLDMSYNGGGSMNSVRAVGETFGFNLRLQSDGKAILSGSYQGNFGTNQIFAARFNTDGARDLNFGDSGLLMFDVSGYGAENYPYSMELMSDDRIVIGGSAYAGDNPHNFFALRLTTSGQPDPSFGGGAGFVFADNGDDGNWGGLYVDSTGRILIGGDSDLNFGLVRLDVNGNLDPTFGTGGRVQLDLGGMDIMRGFSVTPSGRIIGHGDSNTRGQWDFAAAMFFY